MMNYTQWVITIFMAFCLGLVCSTSVHAQTCNILQNDPTHIYCDGELFEVKGMNYYQKDNSWNRFWENYWNILPQIDAELDYAEALGVNTVRFFIPWVDPCLSCAQDFLNRLPQGMKAIPTLFDLVCDPTDIDCNNAPPPYSDHSNSKDYIYQVVSLLGNTNSTIMAWDIKNELDRDYEKYGSDPQTGEDNVKKWAREMLAYIKGVNVDPNHLVSIGFYGVNKEKGPLCYDNTKTVDVYDPNIAADFSSYVDFVSMHYFLSERCFAGDPTSIPPRKGDLEKLIDLIGDKPIILEEFGLHTWSCSPDDPHTEEEQAAYYNALLSVSEAHDIAGYLFWTLNDFSYVLPPEIMEESHCCQGILHNSLVNKCPSEGPFSDYSEKPAARVVRQHYDDKIRYLDTFDSWAKEGTDEPPAGWFDNYTALGGGLLRGFKKNPPQEEIQWASERGLVAFFKPWGSLDGKASSPEVTVNIDTYPFLNGLISSYELGDATGSDCRLQISVKKESESPRKLSIIGPLLPKTSYAFSFDLRKELGWNGKLSYQIILELIPVSGNGYSATYELDYISISSEGLSSYLLWTR